MNRCWTIAGAALLALASSAAQARADYLPEHIAQVKCWYVRFFGHDADPKSLNHWCCQLAWHKPKIEVLTGILGCDEYYQKHGSCPDGYINGLFVDFLYRGPSPYEVEYWKHRLQARHQNRQRLALEFLQTSAFELARPLPHVPMLAPPVFPPVPTAPPSVMYP